MTAVAAGARPLAGAAARRAKAALGPAGQNTGAVRRRGWPRPLRRGVRRAVGGVSETFQPDLDFDATREAVQAGEALIVDLDAYEGPLDVLLALARAQKVDLLQVSIAKLADQYLVFVREARRQRFSLAADYLVMAAWLAWLKSRLLLPQAGSGRRRRATSRRGGPAPRLPPRQAGRHAQGRRGPAGRAGAGGWPAISTS